MDGPWEDVLARLYDVFDADFKQGRPSFEGRPVWWDRRILPGGSYEEGFWHLVTEEDKETGERLPDFRRAERLTWCAPTIRHADDEAVTVWDYEESSGKVRTYLWLENHEYVVILEKADREQGGKRIHVAILVTAHFIKHEWKRTQLRRKYEQRCR